MSRPRESQSDVNGRGYGDAHFWVRGETAQFCLAGRGADHAPVPWLDPGDPRGADRVLRCGSCPFDPQMPRHTHYVCRVCGVAFAHKYNHTPDIFAAIREAGVPGECSGRHAGSSC